MIIVILVILGLGCSKSDDGGESTNSSSDNDSGNNCQGLCITIKYKK